MTHQPYQILTYNSPLEAVGKEIVFGTYVKDTWQVGSRLTLNLGFRYDQYRVFYEDQDKPAGQFSGAQSVQGRDVLEWKKVVPRVGAAFDPFGHGQDGDPRHLRAVRHRSNRRICARLSPGEPRDDHLPLVRPVRRDAVHELRCVDLERSASLVPTSRTSSATPAERRR